jgi:hypothetical protein
MGGVSSKNKMPDTSNWNQQDINTDVRERTLRLRRISAMQQKEVFAIMMLTSCALLPASLAFSVAQPQWLFPSNLDACKKIYTYPFGSACALLSHKTLHKQLFPMRIAVARA